MYPLCRFTPRHRSIQPYSCSKRNLGELSCCWKYRLTIIILREEALADLELEPRQWWWCLCIRSLAQPASAVWLSVVSLWPSTISRITEPLCLLLLQSQRACLSQWLFIPREGGRKSGQQSWPLSASPWQPPSGWKLLPQRSSDAMQTRYREQSCGRGGSVPDALSLLPQHDMQQPIH